MRTSERCGLELAQPLHQLADEIGHVTDSATAISYRQDMHRLTFVRTTLLAIGAGFSVAGRRV